MHSHFSVIPFPENKWRRPNKYRMHRHIKCLLCAWYLAQGFWQMHWEYLKEAAKKVPIFILNGSMAAKNIYSILCDDRQSILELTNSILLSGSASPIYLYPEGIAAFPPNGSRCSIAWMHSHFSVIPFPENKWRRPNKSGFQEFHFLSQT